MSRVNCSREWRKKSRKGGGSGNGGGRGHRSDPRGVETEKNRKKKKMRPRMGLVGGLAIPTLYKSLFLPTTCPVFQFERRGCVRLSTGIIVFVLEILCRTMPCWKKEDSMPKCCGVPPRFSSPWYVFLFWHPRFYHLARGLKEFIFYTCYLKLLFYFKLCVTTL